jgi:flagellar motility protein MotE (MotC chaperone)
MGRIFSHPFGEGEEDPEDGIQDSKMPQISSGKSQNNDEVLRVLDNGKQIEEEISSLKKRHEQKLEDFKERNQVFHEIMNE